MRWLFGGPKSKILSFAAEFLQKEKRGFQRCKNGCVHFYDGSLVHHSRFFYGGDQAELAARYFNSACWKIPGNEAYHQPSRVCPYVYHINHTNFPQNYELRYIPTVVLGLTVQTALAVLDFVDAQGLGTHEMTKMGKTEAPYDQRRDVRIITYLCITNCRLSPSLIRRQG